MLEVVSISEYSKTAADEGQSTAHKAASARRGGLVHGTRVATTRGWKSVEHLVAGDLVRTLDNGFRPVRRIQVDRVVVPGEETRAAHLPVLVPARTTYNGRPVWLMPEQGIAVEKQKLQRGTNGISVLPARVLSGMGRVISRTPAQVFDVTSLFFDEDQVIFIEGGFQAFCPTGRMASSPAQSVRAYDVVASRDASVIAEKLDHLSDVSIFANPLGALPAPIPQDPIFPIRPHAGVRRPGRPGRPAEPVLVLLQEWRV